MIILNPNVPSFGDFIDNFGELINKTISDADSIRARWAPVLERHFDGIRLSENNLRNISLYMEICHKYYLHIGKITGQNYDLVDVMDKLKKDIKGGLNNKRSAVIRKVFNYQLGKMEYELEDGNFVQINESVTSPKLEIEEIFFPDEFLKIIDPQKWRDLKIDQIL